MLHVCIFIFIIERNGCTLLFEITTKEFYLLKLKPIKNSQIKIFVGEKKISLSEPTVIFQYIYLVCTRRRYFQNRSTFVMSKFQAKKKKTLFRGRYLLREAQAPARFHKAFRFFFDSTLDRVRHAARLRYVCLPLHFSLDPNEQTLANFITLHFTRHLCENF